MQEQKKNYQKELEKNTGKNREGRAGSDPFASQLLRAVQQLCDGVSFRLFPDRGFLL